MPMPEYADIWEITDTVIMERPRQRYEDAEQPEPSDEDPGASETMFST